MSFGITPSFGKVFFNIRVLIFQVLHWPYHSSHLCLDSRPWLAWLHQWEHQWAFQWQHQLELATHRFLRAGYTLPDAILISVAPRWTNTPIRVIQQHYCDATVSEQIIRGTALWRLPGRKKRTTKRACTNIFIYGFICYTGSRKQCFWWYVKLRLYCCITVVLYNC